MKTISKNSQESINEAYDPIHKSVRKNSEALFLRLLT